MPPQHKRLKVIEFTLNGVRYETQVTTWKINNNTGDGERYFTYAVDGEFYEAADDSYELELTYLADWTLGGISDVLMSLDGQTVGFVVTNHPDDALSRHVRSGNCKVKAPTEGGEVRSTEVQTVSFPIIGKPLYTRP